MGMTTKTDYHDMYYLESGAWIRNWEVFRMQHEVIRAYGKPVVISLTPNLTSRIVNADKARRVWGADPWWFAAPEHINTNSTMITGFTERADRLK